MCGYCAYGLFVALVLALKSKKSPGNLGVCRVQFHLGVNGLMRWNFPILYRLKPAYSICTDRTDRQPVQSPFTLVEHENILSPLNEMGVDCA